MFLLALLITFAQNAYGYLDKETLRVLVPFRECLNKRITSVCLKEQALQALNESISSDKPMVFMDMIEIGRNPDYKFPQMDNDLPLNTEARSLKLSDILYSRIEDFFKSRFIKFNLSPAPEEARKKKQKGMLMFAMGGIGYMMTQMFMGKIAFMAGAALMIAKMALLLSAVLALKKLSSGGGGESHVVVASSPHGHEGWHRSINNMNNNDAQSLAYKAHITEATGF